MAALDGLEALAKARGVSVAALGLEAVQRLLAGGTDVAAPQSSKPRPAAKQVAAVIELRAEIAAQADEIKRLKRELAARPTTGALAAVQPVARVSERTTIVNQTSAPLFDPTAKRPTYFQQQAAMKARKAGRPDG